MVSPRVRPNSEFPLRESHARPGTRSLEICDLLSLEDLALKHGILVILYDQIGCGNSTHLEDKKGDASFWTVDLFLDELENLLERLGIQANYDLFGNSWGGMLGAEHGARRPKGLHRLIVADSPASMDLWAEAANKLRAQLPENVEAVLRKHEDEGTTESLEYEKAVMYFYKLHVCRVDPMPQDVVDSFDLIKKDGTVYHTMFVSPLPQGSRSCG